MHRIVLRIRMDRSGSRLVHCGRPTDYGVLVRERIASLVPDFPEAGIHRIELAEYEGRVILTAGDSLVRGFSPLISRFSSLVSRTLATISPAQATRSQLQQTQYSSTTPRAQ